MALFACYPVRRLDAEVLADALHWLSGKGESYSSAIPEPYSYIPEDQPTVCLADGSITSQFLETFGRPARDTGLASERRNESTFGQSCLVARRLVERGVPYVTVNYKGWDIHKQHFETMRRKLPELDKGMATLLQNLADRGLLATTIVWWGGEFGRIPRIDW